MKAAAIYVFVLSGICITLSVAAVILGAWWCVTGGPSLDAFNAAFACFVAGGLTGILGAAIGVGLDN